MKIMASARPVLGSWIIALAATYPAQADPPRIPTAPRPFRNFPSAEELKAFLEPIPEKPYPDDPPPHEGAMIDVPYIIEPPDLILVEALEALPGRPISGERLVHPDGTVNLGWYGFVHVRGLTLDQAKVKIILHLRKHLPDDVLGIYRVVDDNTDKAPEANDAGAIPPLPNFPQPRPEENDLQPNAATTPRVLRGARQAVTPLTAQAQPARPGFLKAPQRPREQKPQPAGEHRQESPAMFQPPRPIAGQEGEGDILKAVHPVESDRVLVGITAFNSKVYYVQGDVAYPGRLPWTGGETVLDIIQYAGGFLPTVEFNDIRLVRRARGGKPARVYKIDLKAIIEDGNPKANYQILPGDRLFVGRNATVKHTVETDRVAAQLQTMVNTVTQSAYMLRAVAQASGNTSLTPAQREEILKPWADFWWQVSKSGTVAADEKTFREAFMQTFRLPTPEPKKESK